MFVVYLTSSYFHCIATCHPGIVCSEMLARSIGWWLSLNTDVELLCDSCSVCAKLNFKPKANFVPWPPAKFPFQESR